MLLEYFVLFFQLIIAMPYIIKLKHFAFLNFNYFIIFICGLGLHYFIFYSFLYLDTFIKKYLKNYKYNFGRYLLLFFATVPYLSFEISLFVFGYRLDRVIIASALENETEMIFYFINFKIILFSIIFTIIMYFVIKKIKIDEKISKVSFSISSVIVLLLIIFTIATKNRVYLVSYPIIDCFDLFKVGKTIEGFKYQTDKSSFEKNITELNKIFNYKNKDNGLNVVLVIGESARSDFFNKFATILEDENSINFVKSKSSYMYTREAVPEILTLPDINSSKNYSLVNIMDSLGFNTFWIGAQSIRGNTDSPYAHFAIDSKVHIYRDNGRIMKYDLELIKYLDEILENSVNKINKTEDNIIDENKNNTNESNKTKNSGNKDKNKSNENNFFIIHQMGSHTPFFKRFEKQYIKFDNYCKSKDTLLCSHEELYNAYANSIVYTDVFLKEVIKRFRNKNTILIYTSDHATDSIYINKDEDRLIIPMFVWVNGDMIKIKGILENNSKKEKTFSHKKIIESILDCIGVESSLINKENSICSLEYR